MGSWLWGLIAATFLRALGLYRDWKSRKAGRDEQKLEQAENTLERTQKAKGAWSRLTLAQRDKLRKRYNRK